MTGGSRFAFRKRQLPQTCIIRLRRGPKKDRCHEMLTIIYQDVNHHLQELTLVRRPTTEHGFGRSNEFGTAIVGETRTLELSLMRVPVPTPKDDEVVVRVEATPINPSDLGLLLAAADVSAATKSGGGMRK